ncbi:heme ABC exporter ATP-binding protein CcmA [Amylibacter marinus]|nr:heme ABC exporter ATP-binding protein CcmA [Amylibacter marinus]
MKIESLTCRRASTPILQGVNLELHSGMITVLRGPNGSGKTTLLRHLAGLGSDTQGLDTEEIVFSGHLDAIKATLTVGENLRFWAGVYSKALDPAIIENFELSDLIERPAGRLSAGQKRRLGLARVVLSGAKVWLLDEPTVSLDTASTDRLVALIADHSARGGACILSTHIDLALPQAQILDITQFKASSQEADPFLSGDFT